MAAADAALFGRQDDDVIDWLRATTAERWQTYNIRDVSTLGFEVGVQKTLRSGAFVHAQYTAIDVDAATVDSVVEVRARLRAAVVRGGGGDSAARPRFVWRRGWSTAGARVRPARPTTCCSTPVSAAGSAVPSISSSTGRICSTSATRRSRVSRCRAPPSASRSRSEDSSGG